MGHSLNRAMLSVAGAALLGAFFGGTPVRAAEDWDSVNWRALSYEMNGFLCGRDRAPAWCPEWRAWTLAPVGKAQTYGPDRTQKPVEAKAPPREVPDDQWKAVVARIAGAKPTEVDLEIVRKRAFRDGDPAAFEILGYVNATGWGATADYEKAYEYYGMAFLAGATHAKENMDRLWTQLSEDARSRLTAKFEKSAPPKS